MREKQDGLTLIAYALIGVGAVIYGSAFLGAALLGLTLTFPFGLIGLVILGMPAIGFGLLVVKVVRDRLQDPEDRHYSRDIHE